MIRALHLVFYALSLNLVLCHFFSFMIYVGYTHIHVRLKISKIDAKKKTHWSKSRRRRFKINRFSKLSTLNRLRDI